MCNCSEKNLKINWHVREVKENMLNVENEEFIIMCIPISST